MEPFDAYKSIASPSEGLFKDNGSRFIALAYPVETEEEVREIVNGLRKEYHDARHHCYAYRLGYKRDIFHASDDGSDISAASNWASPASSAPTKVHRPMPSPKPASSKRLPPGASACISTTSP